MSEGNARDTQFQGFAKATRQEIMGIVAEQVANLERGIGRDPIAEARQIELLLARRAYDLACHIVQRQAQGIDLCFANDPKWIQERVELTPDLLELPKED